MMNRPYRDDEERQLYRVEMLLEDASWQVHCGDLDKAVATFCEADEALDKLITMVQDFDKGEV
jgi:hypothetical protein